MIVREFGSSARVKHLPRKSLKKVSLTKRIFLKAAADLGVRSPCLDETNDSTIAKGAKVTRHMVAKQFERIKRMLGIQKPLPIL